MSDLDQYLKAIESKGKNFFHNVKEDYSSIRYVYIDDKTFQSDDPEVKNLLLNCRGVVFNNSGDIISLPFHKFFNINENDDYLQGNIDFSKRHYIMTKYDGSMIRPLFIKGGFRLATKAAITDTSIQCENFLSKSGRYFDYLRFFKICHKFSLTPLFEYVSPNNRIVLNYDEDDLILLAVRDIKTGKYLDIKEIYKILDKYNIKVSKAEILDSYIDDISSFINEVRDIKKAEGFVVFFPDDSLFVKIKCDEYCKIHKFIDKIKDEKNIVASILSETIDDILPVLYVDDRNKLTNYINKFNKIFDHKITELDEIYQLTLSKYKDKKDFAIHTKCDNIIKSMLFSKYDGKHSHDIIKKYLEKCMFDDEKFNVFMKDYWVVSYDKNII